MATINSEMRTGPGGEPEVWANLGDILDWLDSLPTQTNNQIAEAVAMEIRQMLFGAVENAQVIVKE